MTFFARQLVPFLCATAALSLSPVGWLTPRAHACSPVPCAGPSVFPPAGELPADQLRLRFRPATGRSELAEPAPRPHLYRVDGATRTELTLTSVAQDAGSSWLTVAESLPAGTVVVLEADALECYGTSTPLRAEYVITDARAKPASLGPLRSEAQRGPLAVAVTSGSCFDEIDAAFVDFDLSLSEATQPFANVLTLALLLDDKPVAAFLPSLGRSKLEDAAARIYTACGDNVRHESLVGETRPGTYRARLRGTLPDGTTLDTTETEVTLRCEGKPDASVPQADGGALPVAPPAVLGGGSGSVGPNAEPMTVPGDDDAGCTTSRRRTSGSTWCIGLLLGLAARRRLQRHNRQVARG